MKIKICQFQAIMLRFQSFPILYTGKNYIKMNFLWANWISV